MFKLIVEYETQASGESTSKTTGSFEMLSKGWTKYQIPADDADLDQYLYFAKDCQDQCELIFDNKDNITNFKVSFKVN